MIAQKYEQIIELGQTYRSSMSKLYKALDTHHQQWVVIKIMKGKPNDELADRKMRQMFKQEINIALSLKHDHILRAIDYGDVVYAGHQVPYIAYPYMEDGSLRELISDLPPWENWSLMQTADIILQAAKALMYMHTLNQPLVHWDVKPDNFLIRREQGSQRVAHLFLCDFGISREQKAHFDITSQPWGTPSYMAPEQFAGRIMTQSDQYTLALMACYLLTGEYPLRAANPFDPNDWKRVHQTEPPLYPSALNPQRVYPGEVDRVILKALNKEPEQRFPTIWAFAWALYNAIRQQEAAEPTERLDQVAQLPLSAPPNISVQPQLEPIPLHPRFDTDAYQIVDESPPVVQQNIVTPSAKNVWKSLHRLPLKLFLKRRLPARPHMICWSHDGNYIACLFLEHAPIIVDRNDRMKVVPTVDSGHAACWAPYGYVLAVSLQYNVKGEDHSKICVVNMDVPAVWPYIISLRVPIIDALDLSANGQLAVWTSEESQVRIYTVPKTLLPAQPASAPQILSMQNMTCGGIGVLRWSPDGSLLAAGAANGALICWRADTYRIQWQKSASFRQVYSLAWSPDSTLLAVAFKDKRVVVWNVHEDRIQVEWKNLPVVPRMLSISRGRRLVVASNKGHLLIGSVDERFGSIDKHAPSVMHSGHWLAAWSPTRLELATLDPEQEETLVVWRE